MKIGKYAALIVILACGSAFAAEGDLLYDWRVNKAEVFDTDQVVTMCGPGHPSERVFRDMRAPLTRIWVGRAYQGEVNCPAAIDHVDAVTDLDTGHASVFSPAPHVRPAAPDGDCYWDQGKIAVHYLQRITPQGNTVCAVIWLEEGMPNDAFTTLHAPVGVWKQRWQLESLRD